jgi:hypothetical protein
MILKRAYKEILNTFQKNSYFVEAGIKNVKQCLPEYLCTD